MKPRSITIILTFFLSGCFTYLDKNLFKFNESELVHIQCYHPGDTLLFENKLKKIDSFLVLDYKTEERGQEQGIISTKPESDYWLNIRQLNKNELEQENWRGVLNKDTMNGTVINYQWLLTIAKYPPKHTLFYTFRFMNFYTQQDSTFGIFHSDTISINNKSFTKYYSIAHGFPDRLTEPTDIEQLLWTDKEGLIAYKYKSGIWFTKNSR